MREVSAPRPDAVGCAKRYHPSRLGNAVNARDETLNVAIAQRYPNWHAPP
jgi:hypothetical protein